MSGDEGSGQDLERLLVALREAAAARLDAVRNAPLVAESDPVAIQAHLDQRYDFAEPVPAGRLIADVISLLGRADLDSTHPRYFGLFNPPALPITAAADALVAMLNPQVGTRTHAPAANAIEEHVLRCLAGRIGFDPGACSGHFTSGGQEANTTALACALSARFPAAREAGLRALPGQPTVYVSEHGHHSLLKAARLLGFGSDAVREIASDESGAMRLDALTERIAADRAAGELPFMLVGTAGTTGIGSIDPLNALADLAATEDLWLHVDAAWGGGALMSDRLRGHLAGIERADSVTWDAHKWLNVPMGAGMVFFRSGHPGAEVFNVTTGYVPLPRNGGGEPYLQTFQWSRRFIGLKVFMALAELGLDGYARLVEHQCEMAGALRARLRRAGWTVVNHTPLPLVCFTHPSLAGDPDATGRLVDAVLASGRVWVSRIVTPDGQAAVRTSITSYQTQEKDLDILIDVLEAVRSDE
jgi:glutamate/tyrosine decarboxylase-like PLP-dependent enzyme